jgi:hypothetical protein
MPSVHANRRSNAPNESRGRPVVLASLLLALLLGLVSAGAWWGGWFGVKEDPRLTEVKTVMAEAAAKYPPDQAPKNMLDTAARVGTMVTVMAKIQSSSNVLFVALIVPLAKPTTTTLSPCAMNSRGSIDVSIDLDAVSS